MSPVTHVSSISRTIYVGKHGFFGFRYYPTINEAIDYINSLMDDSAPSNTNRFNIRVCAGEYEEDIVLPEFVSLIGEFSGVQLRGNAIDATSGIILDVAQGSSIEYITIAPKGADKKAGLVIRDTTMILGGNVVDTTVSGILHVNGNDLDSTTSDEWIEFTGEASLDEVVALINTGTTFLYAWNRFDKLALMSRASDVLAVYMDGSANELLGFDIDEDTIVERSNEPTRYVSTVSVIGKGGYSGLSVDKRLDCPVIHEDRMTGGAIYDGLSITGGSGDSTAVGLSIKRGVPIFNSLLVTGISGGVGMKTYADNYTVKATPYVESLLMYGNGIDIDGETGSYVYVKAVNPNLRLGNDGTALSPMFGIDGIYGLETWGDSRYANLTNFNTHTDNTSNPHEVTKTQIGLGNITNILDKLDASTYPITNNDVDEGYSVLSSWIDIENRRAYICLDNGDTTAMWHQIGMSRFDCIQFYETSSDCVNTTMDTWVIATQSSGTVATTSGAIDHPGIIRITSSATTDSGGRLLLGTTSILINGGEETEFIFRALTVSDLIVRLGFGDVNTNAAPVDGIWLNIANNVLSGKTAIDSTTSITVTSYNISANIWYRGKIVVNMDGTRVDFYLYDSPMTQVLWTDNLTKNLPTGTTQTTGHGVWAIDHANPGTATAIFDIDWLALRIRRKLNR